MERKNGYIYFEEGGIRFSLKEADLSAHRLTIGVQPKDTRGKWQPAAEILTQEARVSWVNMDWRNSPELVHVVSAVCSLCASRLAA